MWQVTEPKQSGFSGPVTGLWWSPSRHITIDDLDEYTEMLEVDELAADFDRLEYEDEIVTIVLDD